MAQADYNVANGSGAVVRADINAQLEAAVTNNSGSSAPSPTFPNMWWPDLTNGLLKQRNNANTDWIIRGVLADEYFGIPASAIPYDPGSPALLAADNVQAAIDEVAAAVAANTAAFKVVQTTYDVSLASNFSVTGVGFTPKAVIALGTPSPGGNSWLTAGFSDASNGQNVFAITAAAWSFGSFLNTFYDGTNRNDLSLVSFDSDGATFSRTKTGSPTGTQHLSLLFFR